MTNCVFYSCTWVPIHLCEMFRVFCFGTMHTDRVQNKTHEVSHTTGWEQRYTLLTATLIKSLRIWDMHAGAIELRERWRFESYNVMTTLLKFMSISQSYVLFNIVHINANKFGENLYHHGNTVKEP